MGTLLQLSPGVVVGGDFRVVEPLNAGGMGALYVVEQLSTGKRRALKVMHRQLLRDVVLRERFMREARVGSLIESDHVVEVISAGVEEPAGVPWIVMELLEGQDLADHVAEHGPFTFRDAMPLVRQLCHALAAAHRAGVVHRDIKPENVFLARTRRVSSPLAVKVLDFGVAKLLAQACVAGTSAIGSPAWMAPEQAEAGTSVHPAADVWSLGLLVFWLLTGEPYWNAARGADASVHALMREVLFDPLVPASERVRARGGDCPWPESFDRWFVRCVVRPATERFEDAAEAFADLSRVAEEVGYVDEAAGEPSWEPSAVRPSVERISTVPAEPAWPHAGQAIQVTAAALVTASSAWGERPARLPLHSRAGSLGGLVALVAMFVAVVLMVGGDGLVTSHGTKHLGVAAPPSWLGGRRTPTVASSTARVARPVGGTTRGTPPSAGQPGAESVAVGRLDPGSSPSASAEAGPSSTNSAPAGPSSTASAPAGPSAPPATTSSAPPLHTSTATSEPLPAPVSPPALGAFDRRAAQAEVRLLGEVAAQSCAGFPGPRAVSAEVVFAPTGLVRRVAIGAHDQRAGTTVSCVRLMLHQARVSPYEGGDERVNVSIALP